MLARYMLSSCVCLSVRPSDTRKYCIKTAKCWITQITPYGSAGTLVFCCQKFRRHSNGVTPKKAPNRSGVGSNGDFRQISRYISATAQDKDILLLCNANRNSNVLYRLVRFPLTTFRHFVSPFISSQWVEIETSNLVGRLIVASDSQWIANHP